MVTQPSEGLSVVRVVECQAGGARAALKTSHDLGRGAAQRSPHDLIPVEEEQPVSGEADASHVARSVDEFLLRDLRTRRLSGQAPSRLASTLSDAE